MEEESKELPTQVKPQKLTESDRLEVEILKMRKQLANEQQQKAVLFSENAELKFRYTVLLLYKKYGLSDEDAIDENGAFIFGGTK